MLVRIPGLLRSYTADAATVDVDAQAIAPDARLDDVLRALDRRYPGMRFRIIDEQDHVRAHIKLFVDGELVRALSTEVGAARELMIVGARSGG